MLGKDSMEDRVLSQFVLLKLFGSYFEMLQDVISFQTGFYHKDVLSFGMLLGNVSYPYFQNFVFTNFDLNSLFSFGFYNTSYQCLVK